MAVNKHETQWFKEDKKKKKRKKDGDMLVYYEVDLHQISNCTEGIWLVCVCVCVCD